MNSIISDDINNIDSDIYLMTHTTNPFLSSKSIIDALDLFQHKKNLNAIDSLFTVNKFQSRFYNKHCDPINHDPNNLIRTQDLEPWYEENSNLYIFTKESFNSSNARIGKNPIFFETPRFESFDIDNQDDWVLAELVAKYIK
jgi:CMP-N-acetylneuraminic acid synthetase